jgi:hypothetical protein
MHHFLRFLRSVLIYAVALLLLFEEWGWEPLARMFGQLSRLPLWAHMERRISALPPWAAMLAFGLPMLLLLPVKLLALYLFSIGHAAVGLVVLLSAKIAGTALLARLFQLTQPALMQLAWFARCYPRWKSWKDSVLNAVRRSEPWHACQRFKLQVRDWMASVF